MLFESNDAVKAEIFAHGVDTIKKIESSAFRS